MKTMSVGEFKTHFSDVIEQVKAKEQFAVTFGKKKEVVGYFVPGMNEQPTSNHKSALTVASWRGTKPSLHALINGEKCC